MWLRAEGGGCSAHLADGVLVMGLGLASITEALLAELRERLLVPTPHRFQPLLRCQPLCRAALSA